MNYGAPALPVTGMAGFALFGHSFGLAWMIGGAVVAIVGGAIMFRFASKNRRHGVAS